MAVHEYAAGHTHLFFVDIAIGTDILHVLHKLDIVRAELHQAAVENANTVYVPIGMQLFSGSSSNDLSVI